MEKNEIDQKNTLNEEVKSLPEGEAPKEQQCTNAPEKLKKELEQEKESRVPAEYITKYLISKCDDPEFAKRVLIKEKNLKECFDYVYSKVREKLSGTSGWIDDNEVYKMAETYFTLDHIEIKQEKPISSSTNAKIENKKVTVKNNVKSDLKKKSEQFTLFDLMR